MLVPNMKSKGNYKHQICENHKEKCCHEYLDLQEGLSQTYCVLYVDHYIYIYYIYSICIYHYIYIYYTPYHWPSPALTLNPCARSAASAISHTWSLA